MNALPRLALLWIGLLLCAAPVMAQDAVVTGLVTDAQDGQTLVGANVALLDDAGTIVRGGVTDIDGRYQLDDLDADAYTLEVRYIGYEPHRQLVTLTAGETRRIDVALASAGLTLGDVVVTGVGRPEVIQDAPASITLLKAEELQANTALSSVSALRNTPGLDQSQTGVDRSEVVLRGFNNAFSGSAFVLTDYRQSAVPSLGVNIFSIMPNMSIDLERVEVVRGPGSALYGAGADAGVIHFITKNPFDHPGTTVAVAGGQQAALDLQARHAGVIGRSLGYKITGAFTRADDFSLDADDPLDAAQLDNDFVYGDCTDVPDGQDTLPLDGGGCKLVRNYDYQKLNVNGLLQYRPNDRLTLSLNGGYSALDAIVLSGIGTLQANGFGYTYAQARLQMLDVLGGNVFGQFYLNRNDAGDSYVYGSGLSVVDKGMLYTAQAQYDASTWQDRQQFIVGLDAEFTRPDTEGLILGRNEDDDAIDEYGAYVQSVTSLTQKLDLTLALRGDYNTIVEDVQLSPRAALVYKPVPGHTLRATYNQAFSSPGTNSNFLDIVAGQVPGTDILVRGRGSGRGFTWQRDASFADRVGTDLVASSLNPSALGFPTPVGLPLGSVYGAVYGGLAATPSNLVIPVIEQGLGLPAGSIDEQTYQGLLALLAPSMTQVTGDAAGELRLLNLSAPEGATFDQQFQRISGLDDIEPLAQTTSQTFELGYKGAVKSRLLLAVDGYYTQKKDFIGPLAMESPFVFVPTLRSDLAAALGEGIAANPQLAGTLAQLGATPEEAAALIVGFAGGSLPSAQTPVAIVQAAENNPGAGRTPELMLAYRNFGDLDYWGVDVALEYLATDELDLFANLSIVSDDFFDAEELGETNEDLALALNAPKFKAKAGGRYAFPFGLSLSASGRYVEGFPVSSGPYQGNAGAVVDVDSFFQLDLGAGYAFDDQLPGLRLDVLIQNVLNDEHREFLGAPKLGRLALARLTYTL